MFPLLIFLLAQVISPQVDEVIEVYPKGEKEPVKEVSSTFSITGWEQINIEFIGTPSDWEKLEGVRITVSVECSIDGGKYKSLLPPNTFVGGKLGSLGDGMPRIILKGIKGGTCRVTTEPNKQAEIGVQVSNVKK